MHHVDDAVNVLFYFSATRGLLFSRKLNIDWPLMTSQNSEWYEVEETNYAIKQAIGLPRSILDVGCGAGLLSSIAKQRGAYVIGIERNPIARELAQKRLDEVLDADITQEKTIELLKGRTFDLIIFADVLEHIVDPLATLKSFASLLNPGGRILISVPNIAAWTIRWKLLSGRFRYENSGILDKTHLRFFDEQGARDLIVNAGLELLSTDSNPMLVRSLRDHLKSLVSVSSPQEPVLLDEQPLYRWYTKYIRPLEGKLASLRPNLLAFQHILIARKPPLVAPMPITVGMLTYNEEESVGPMIDAIRNEVPDAEILLVDSSTDRTAEIAKEKGATVIVQLPARGHGPAMERLLREAAKREGCLVYLDCDFTYPVAEIPRIRAMLESGTDVVNAVRTRTRPEAMPLPNYIANRVFAATASIVHGIPTVDVHSGMRGYRCDTLRAFLFDSHGDALPLDMLILPARYGFRVIEYPIPYHERVGLSKLRKWSGTAWTFLRIANAIGKGHRPTKYTVLPK